VKMAAYDISPQGNLQQENKSKLIHARKILELRIEVLVDAISECHMAVATRKMWKEIEASMDAVEIAWDKIRRTSSEFVSHAGLNLDHLPMMVEMVLTKAEKYLAKAQAKMEKWWEAQVQALEAEKASEQPRETSYEMPRDDEDRGKELNDKVNEVAPEVSAVNEVNEVALEESTMNKVNNVNKDSCNVNDMNDVNDVNKDSCVACNIMEVAPVSILEGNEVELHSIAHNVLVEIKEEVSEGKPLEVMRKGSFTAKSEVWTSWEPGESGVVKLDEVKIGMNIKAQVEIIAEALEEQNGAKVWERGESGVTKLEEVEFDVYTEAMEVSGVKDVMQSDRLTMMKVTEQSRCANWDPGELVNVKEPIEMLDVEEVTILVNDDKVRLRGNVNLKALYDAMTLYSIVRFNVKAIVIVLFLSRFVNGFRRKCPIELSDYG